MRVEHTDISLRGAREDNQDRVSIAIAKHASLLLVFDGMGGHAQGARAAEVAQKVMLDAFWRTLQPLFDPLGFLHLTLGRAHEEVVRLGAHLPLEQRPRATCAACLVQEGAAWWAHVGDSRIYHLRDGEVLARTRDHSHVEGLLRVGQITPEEAYTHPKRNFVECCLGGDPIMPDMSTGGRHVLKANDVLLLCTDGFWNGLRDEEIAKGATNPEVSLRDAIYRLAERAVAQSGVTSDNTTAGALRWLG